MNKGKLVEVETEVEDFDNSQYFRDPKDIDPRRYDAKMARALLVVYVCLVVISLLVL